MRSYPLLCAGLALWVACSGDGDHGDGGQQGDASDDGADASLGDGGGEPDTEGRDEGGDPSPGPMTFVATDNIVILDRLCDLDGDGVEDNAIADLGTSDGTLFAMALNAAMQSSIERGVRRIVHLPWVEDRATPHDLDVVVTAFNGIDEEGLDDLNDRDPTDDFDGDEGFYAFWDEVDSCGEPLSHAGGTRLDRGEIAGETPLMRFMIAVEGTVNLRRVVLSGEVEPGGSAMVLRVCGAATIPDVGAAPFLPGGDEELTALEMLIVGGAAFGVPALPGLSPDLDLDGDGLERFVVNGSGQIERCVDADGTTIEGRDCWQDPRMADAFSLVIELTSTSARFLGVHPSWEGWVTEPCEAPPAESLWDPR